MNGNCNDMQLARVTYSHLYISVLFRVSNQTVGYNNLLCNCYMHANIYLILCNKLQYQNFHYHDNVGQSRININDTIKLLAPVLNNTIIFSDNVRDDSSVLPTVTHATASTSLGV